jgi:hypothetical protein
MMSPQRGLSCKRSIASVVLPGPHLSACYTSILPRGMLLLLL